MSTASIAVEEALLLLKLGFLVLLYLFLWVIVRSASRDLRAPQESFVLAPQQRARPAARPRTRSHGRLVLVGGGSAQPTFELDSSAVTIGRGPANDIALEDDYASTLHARVEARHDGVWVVDVGSTNGTIVNGERIADERKLAPGDVIRVGATELRYER